MHYYRNSQECIKFIEEILEPFFTKKRHDPGLTVGEKALILITGQMTTEVRKVIKSLILFAANVPADMAKYNQVSQLTVNKYVKAFIR